MSWQVGAGEILGIIGPNGAGKSSCFAAVTHAVQRQGEVWLAGHRVTDLA
ncbi:MAG TPA: ATP-binding cassette domain-containing protein, partial [Reyranella sp.]|nr:ATP-binding cassette domain-containing protein [Reyranella sp.]